LVSTKAVGSLEEQPAAQQPAGPVAVSPFGLCCMGILARREVVAEAAPAQPKPFVPAAAPAAAVVEGLAASGRCS